MLYANLFTGEELASESQPRTGVPYAFSPARASFHSALCGAAARKAYFSTWFFGGISA
jgi:hypothetical protein